MNEDQLPPDQPTVLLPISDLGGPVSAGEPAAEGSGFSADLDGVAPGQPTLPPLPEPGSRPSEPEQPGATTPYWERAAQHAYPQPPRLGCWAKTGIIAALVISLLALAVSSLLLVSFWHVRSTTAAVLDASIGQLEGLCGPNAQPVVFPFSQNIRFQGDFALPEGIVIPFKGSIPINTVVRLVIPGLPGSPTVEIPVQTSVPMDTKVPLPGGITIPIDTNIPVNQEIPLDLCQPGGSASGFLEQTITELGTLRGSLNFP
jgi:hypothetical protein